MPCAGAVMSAEWRERREVAFADLDQACAREQAIISTNVEPLRPTVKWDGAGAPAEVTRAPYRNELCWKEPVFLIPT